jgi:hypothetical protein
MFGRMASQIGEINAKLNRLESAMSSLWAPTQRRVETPDVTIWTSKILVVSGSVPKANSPTVNWSATFDVNFKEPPIVTATPFCNTTGGATLVPSTAWIHQITTNQVRGKWKWLGTSTVKETVYVLVVAIGVGDVG